MTLLLKNVYIDKLNYIVNKCKNTYYSTIKIKPADVKSNTYIDSKEINNGDIVRISKYEKYYCKRLQPKLT